MNGARPERTTEDPEPPHERPDAPPPALAWQGLAPTIDPGFLLRRAWSIFSASWPACLVLYWGAAAAWWLLTNLLVLFLAGLNLSIGDPTVTPFLEFVRFLGIFLIPAWLWIGRGIAVLKIARGQTATPRDLFNGGPYLLTTLLAVGIFLSITAVPCLLVYGLAEGLGALGGGDSLVGSVRHLFPAATPVIVAEYESRLLILLAILVGLAALSYAAFFAVRVRLRPFPLLVLDRGAGVLESLRTSMELTRGRAVPLFLVHLAQFSINLAGLLVGCVGLLVSLPLTSLISAVTYEALAADLPRIESPEESTEDGDTT